MVRPDTGVTIALATFGDKSPESATAGREDTTEFAANQEETAFLGDSAAAQEATKTPRNPEKERARRFTGMATVKPWFKTQESDNKFIGGFAFGLGVVVIGFPKEKMVMKEGKEHTRRWINAVNIKPKLLS
jgi:acetyl esterase/lipase